MSKLFEHHKKGLDICQWITFDLQAVAEIKGAWTATNTVRYFYIFNILRPI